ncbi:Arm DNA-binding domain-containing protein [Xanthomonas oryzae pv. oryzicola]|nr:Arm DNA-binding domain-containing protein [Xanthomonas oryzae]MEC5114894.1 Arm DNA-binding domain-containing protein [Xanthomonas oryzae pv. oryzicola]QEO97291.1 integrase [Xanthomonas oryzae pv. oryzicola]
MALTDTAVRQARTTGKDYTLNDAHGLLLFVSAKGKKKWHFRFTWMGQQQRIAIAPYPEVGLKEARMRRDELRAHLANGVDPRVHLRQAEKKALAAATHTFQAVFQSWRDFKSLSLKAGRQSTLSQINRIFAKDVLPWLDTCPSLT